MSKSPETFPLQPVESEDCAGSSGAVPKREYAAEHKMWIVRRQLEMQPLFDNKLHKNSQKWDDLCN